MTILRNALLGTAVSSAIIAIAMPALAQTTPSLQEMWQMLQAQQAKIDNLETELAEAQVETIEVKKSV